jgi:hypothetical protein
MPNGQERSGDARGINNVRLAEKKSGGFSIDSIAKTPQGGRRWRRAAARTAQLMIMASTSSEGTDVSLTAIEKK